MFQLTGSDKLCKNLEIRKKARILKLMEVQTTNTLTTDSKLVTEYVTTKLLDYALKRSFDSASDAYRSIRS